MSPAALLLERRALDDRAERHVAVGVHVDDADALAGDADLAPRRGACSGRPSLHGRRTYAPAVAPATFLKKSLRSAYELHTSAERSTWNCNRPATELYTSN